ncbi:bile acid:sodium symporter family protein [Blastopirellula sp. JC732]|uniref:Bile acid:sodium symporter family protein n=1 Tax=Blastopirellula sediminis TaxID=2894196 RepID=A0A9X1SGE5_9BACT|nr:bile acid:sodium symporter family protein [Blastopirellula sediminis]MCC9608622.1 bile acid:sodium symporter family protein [Blastopirellula sediminis]MCC9628601.1 bile acid:sodium symporter family protein [Blastopirellula sediminis]
MGIEVAIVGGLIAMAIVATRFFKGVSFTAWVLVGVGMAFCYPDAFQAWWGMPLSLLIVPLIQLIMFGMGTTLSLGDFLRIFREPWPVLLGIVLQYGVMPITGYLLVVAFGFRGELAAGIILTGACSGGVASNLMSYIGRGNVALSVTMTALSTLIAPIMTPLAMTTFAGQYINVDALAMLMGVVKIIIAPVLAGIVANAILYSRQAWLQRSVALLSFAAAFSILGTVTLLLPSQYEGIKQCLALSLFLIAVMSLAKMIMLTRGRKDNQWLDRALPLLSMFGICAILTIITAQTYDVLIQVGGLLFVAAALHNAIGLALGYWGAKFVGKLTGLAGFRLGIFASPNSRLSEADCRTVAFEVGLQNTGMATGLAINVLKSHLAALPPNVFGTWMNISGSLLANYWGRSVEPSQDGVEEIEVGQEPLS